MARAVSNQVESETALGHRLINTHPNSDRSKFYTREVVVIAFVVAGCHGAELFEFVEEALDKIASAIEPFAKGGRVASLRHGSHIGSCAARCKCLAQGIGVVGAVSQQNVASADGAEHVFGATSVMGLAFGEFEQDWQAAGVNERVNLGCQPATRATHATGSGFFFLPLAAC